MQFNKKYASPAPRWMKQIHYYHPDTDFVPLSQSETLRRSSLQKRQLLCRNAQGSSRFPIVKFFFQHKVLLQEEAREEYIRLVRGRYASRHIYQTPTSLFLLRQEKCSLCKLESGRKLLCHLTRLHVTQISSTPFMMCCPCRLSSVDLDVTTKLRAACRLSGLYLHIRVSIESSGSCYRSPATLCLLSPVCSTTPSRSLLSSP